MSHRIERFASTLKHCIAEILVNEMNNPILKNIVICDVLVEKDLRKAKIYVSSPVDELDEIVAQLIKAKGFIKREIGGRMYLKYVPELIFVKDITSTLKWEETGETPGKTNESSDESRNGK
jgi:ribosome-binding factor A